MRKISATYIFPGHRPPLKNGILICNREGRIVSLTDTKGELKEEAGLEHYSGILVPGLVNAHCHLELSHLKNKIPLNSGMGGFVKAINRLRNEAPEIIEAAIQKADREQQQSGTVAAGDVSNTIHSLALKKSSRIRYHTFSEAFGFHPSRAEKAFMMAQFVEKSVHDAGLPASVVPHSPYSVSVPLFEKIKRKAGADHSLLSIHNQESRGEAQFFLDGSGPLADHLQHNLGLDISHWVPPRQSSLSWVLQFLPPENPLLLVHNTFTSASDISALKKQRSLKNTFFVLCPNSNRMIEDHLPPVSLFRKEKLNICLGTDSLASNKQLSVLSEMIALQQHFPDVKLEELIRWATLNGATALQMESHLGSFEPGKKPGINLITGLDLKALKLSGKSSIKVLVSA